MAFDMNMGDSRSMIVRLSEKSHERDFVYDFQPPMTLGKPKKNSKEYKPCMAMDACIRNVLSGFKNDLMYTTTPMFVGYAMLSNVSQEALIRAGVETVASEMVRKFLQWTYDDDYGEEEKEKAIADLESQAAKYKLRETFYNASVKDGYFGGCLVYIDVGDLDDEEKEEPLILDEKTFKKGSLRGFKVIEPINIYPGEYNTTDPTDEHYFNPEYWYILGKKYHASRFLYFASNEAPLLLKPAYNFFGIPQAQLALDYVAHFVANREAAQELLNKFSLTCWKTNMGQALQGKSCKDLMERAKMLIKTKSNNGIMILDKEQEDFVQLNTPLSGVRDIVEMSLNLLTAVWHIPKIEYLGEGEGGLNASSKEQIRSYYDYIMGKKEKDYTQPLETVLKIFQLNLGKGINPALGFKFPPMWDMDDSERAALNKQQADRDAIYLANGVLSQEEVRRRLSLDRNSEYTMIDVDDVPETQEEPLKEVDEQEENEKVRQAMDMAMDDRWITIGARKATETDEGRKGRHILLKEGETPVEAIERTTGTDIDGNGKVGKTEQGEKKEQPKEEGKKEPEQKSETEKKPESKSEEKKEEPKEKTAKELEAEWQKLQEQHNELHTKIWNEYNKGVQGSKEIQEIEKKIEEEYSKPVGETDWEHLDELKKQKIEEMKKIQAKFKEDNPDVVKEYEDFAEKVKSAKERYEAKSDEERKQREEELKQKRVQELKDFTKAYNDFKDSHTVEEANAYARILCNNGGTFAKGTNVETANIMNKTVMGLMSKYESIDKLNHFGTGTRMGSAIMHANANLIEVADKYGKMSKDEIKEYFAKYHKTRDQKQKEYDELLKNKAIDLAKGVDPMLVEARLINAKPRSRFRVWTVQTSAENFIRDTVIHEFGHTIMYRKIYEDLKSKGNLQLVSYNTAINNSDMAKKIKKTMQKARKTGDIYEISEYANTNYHEFFAEVFAMRETNQKLPDYIETMLREVCGK